MAVGEKGTILTSPDGTTWTAWTLGTSDSLSDIAYGNARFVAVGGSSSDGTYSSTILTSPDGVTWTKQNSGTSNWLNGVAYGNSSFVAVGGSGTILTSP